MQEMLRLFIAIELTGEIHQKLDKLIRTIQPVGIRGINWVNSENIHLTLKFLGDTPRTQLRSIVDALAQATRAAAPFEFTVKGTGCFPNPRQPRVLWVGVEAPPQLAALQKNIDESLKTLNIPSESRVFSPHLTLARMSERCDPMVSQKTYNKLMEHMNTAFGSMSVTRITLFQSTLSREGSVYSTQAYIPLHKIS